MYYLIMSIFIYFNIISLIFDSNFIILFKQLSTDELSLPMTTNRG
jgi:hypothetical protein